MDTNVQALKGLYAALNGDPKDVENMATSSEVITAMQDVAAAAATELPVVKKVDEGKVLTVNGNGKWSAALPESPIDDTEASETKTYSSSKIESLIPANELPTVTSSDNGKVLRVASGHWTTGNPYLDLGDAMIDKIILPPEIAKRILLDGCCTFNQDDIKYFASLSTVSGNNVTFLSVSRGTTSTIYKSFTFDKTVETVTNVSIVTVTVNDPATT